jgi:hypothetical protein
MKKHFILISICWFLVTVAGVQAQQVDAAFGGGSLYSSSSNYNGGFFPSEGGGAYVGFSGDVLIKGSLGLQGEVNWRASQGLYDGQYPYRPLFWDFNAIYARRFSNLIGAEALAGIGGESIRFYSGAYSCDIYGNCTNYASSNHFMGDVGGGIRIYLYHNLFVRPEARLYLVHNNQEFSSSYPVRYGVSIGYSFGGTKQ